MRRNETKREERKKGEKRRRFSLFLSFLLSFGRGGGSDDEMECQYALHNEQCVDFSGMILKKS